MKIEIPNPCTEKWETMQPLAEGAFCQVCNKNVIDFTNKKKSEIQSFFNIQTEKVCGRISNTQLLDLNFNSFYNRFKFWQIGKKIKVVLYFVFGLSLFSCGSEQTTGEMMPVGKVAYVDSLDKQKNDSANSFTHGDMGADYKYEADTSKKSNKTSKEQINIPVITSDVPVVPQDDKKHPPPLPVAPNYTGGQAAIDKILYSNLNYPTEAKNKKIEGSVYVMFKVGTDGKTSSFKITKSLGSGCDEEALRLVKLLGNFNSAKQGKQTIESDFGIAVSFKLSK